jgi:hypothetical protein
VLIHWPSTTAINFSAMARFSNRRLTDCKVVYALIDVKKVKALGRREQESVGLIGMVIRMTTDA